MGTAKRDRQRANRQSKLQAAAAAKEKARSRRRVFQIGGIVVAALLAALLYSLLAGGGDDDSPDATDTTTQDNAAATVPTAPPAGRTISGSTPCPKADGSEARTTTFAQAPPMCIDTKKRYTATVHTSEGDLTIALDPTIAPATVNNFVVLSRYHYYDGVPFHRLVTDFVAQVGDANPVGGQLGTGGPGYTFADELPEPEDYVPGVVAMANSGPDTNGSQIFIYVGPSNPFLTNPAYSIFGKVTDGMDSTVAAIMAASTEGGQVTKVITIDGIDITES